MIEFSHVSMYRFSKHYCKVNISVTHGVIFLGSMRVNFDLEKISVKTLQDHLKSKLYSRLCRIDNENFITTFHYFISIFIFSDESRHCQLHAAICVRNKDRNASTLIDNNQPSSMLIQVNS